MRPFWNEAPALLSLRRSNEYRVYATNSLYSKKRTCRYSKNHREEQVASWPHAGLVHANLWTGFSEFLQTPLDYKG
jgi:hypothetical protein